jgi:diguanylate cyclase (GGDEF)-like protein/PAS domain S-box-containing protein
MREPASQPPASPKKDPLPSPSDRSPSAPGEPPGPLPGAPPDGLDALLEGIEDLGLLFDAGGRILRLAPSGARRLGYAPTELIGEELTRLIPRGFYFPLMNLVRRGTPPYPLQRIRFLGKGGGEIPVEANLGRIFVGGEPTHLLIGRDISERLRQEEELERSEERYHTIFDHSPLGIVHIDHDGIVTESNETFLQIAGARRDRMLGLNMVEGVRDERMREAVLRSLAGERGRFEGRYTSVTGNRTTWIKALFSPMTSTKGTFLGVVGVIEDISERKQAEERIAYLSFHDPLTGLLNRHSFDRELARADRASELPLCLIMGDVNGLKLANDAFGHLEGDRLLKAIARILVETGSGEEAIFRWGGDEFLILLPRTGAAQAAERCDRIHERCAQWRGEGIIRPSISLGWGMKDFPEEDFREVCLKASEDRMYANKMREGKRNRMRILAHLEETLHVRSGGAAGEHVRRLQDLCERAALRLGLSETRRRDLRLLAQFHDLGTIGCPPGLLEKAGPLSPEERRRMEEHPTTGYRIARSIPELAGIADLILAHQEHFDGGGYPQGLSGEAIPETARLFALLDVFDVMIHPRPYAPPRSPAQAMAELRRCAGTQFDPDWVERLGDLTELLTEG